MENGQLSLTLALNHGEKMMATQLSAEHLKEQINQLRQEIQTAGLPEYSLTAQMLRESLRTLDRAMLRADWGTAERCVQNAQLLLKQEGMAL